MLKELNQFLYTELSINPLASRIVRMLDGCNFKEFARFLAAFSSRASQEKKLRFMFEVCCNIVESFIL
jgi:Ca2+-binding EF-hand superfamily protein